MLDPLILIGEPLFFNKNIKIYPPSVRQVLSDHNFGMFQQVLTITQDDIRDEIGDKLGPGEQLPTPFEYLMLSSQYLNGFSTLFGQAFLFFCKRKVHFSLEDRLIIFIGEELDETPIEERSLNAENFFDFQNMIRTVCGVKTLARPEPVDSDEDPRVAEIKRRARERDRLKAKRNNKNGISLGVCLTAICCMGIGITPLNIGEMSYASVGAIMSMMQDKEKYDIDIRSLLAGADSKKIKPKYWIRNTDKE